MARIFEVTTIAGRLQDYEVIEVSPMRFANGYMGKSIKYLTDRKGKSCLDDMATHAHHAYSMTGLDKAIKQYPAKLITEHDGERFTPAEIASPEKLRLIYDAFPLSHSIPILRIYPTEGQIFVVEYNPKNAALPLERMTFSPEFGGDLDLQFTGLRCFVTMSNFEEEMSDYYSRDLKRSEIRT